MGRVFPSAPVDEVALWQTSSPWVTALQGELPDQQTLQRISQQHGINQATAYLFQALCQSKNHGPFINQVNAIDPASTT